MVKTVSNGNILSKELTIVEKVVAVVEAVALLALVAFSFVYNKPQF